MISDQLESRGWRRGEEELEEEDSEEDCMNNREMRPPRDTLLVSSSRPREEDSRSSYDTRPETVIEQDSVS